MENKTFARGSKLRMESRKLIAWVSFDVIKKELSIAIVVLSDDLTGPALKNFSAQEFCVSWLSEGKRTFARGVIFLLGVKSVCARVPPPM